METEQIWNEYEIVGDTALLEYIIETPGYIDLNLTDILSTLTKSGKNYISTATASTLAEALSAATENLPVSLSKATSVLVQFVCGTRDVIMNEMVTIVEKLREIDDNVNVCWGMAKDSSLTDRFRVIILSAVDRSASPD